MSDQTNIDAVPSIAAGNDASHAIGLGQMNLHGFLASQRIRYGSEEGIDFTDIYFLTVTYHALRASNAEGAEPEEFSFAEIARTFEPSFGPGHVVVGPAVAALVDAGQSARAALAGFAVARA